jgi:thymidylate kinase
MGGSLTVFELVGLPGAGKTTLAQGLLKRLTEQGRACNEHGVLWRRANSRAGHLTRLAGFTLARGRHIPSTLRFAAAVRPPTDVRMWFTGKLAVWPYRLSVARARGYDAVVLDQGVLQSAWCVLRAGTLQREALLHEAIREVVAACAAQFAFISVDIDANVAAARLAARGPLQAPFNLGKQETRWLLDEHRDELERVVAAGLRVTGAPHLRIDGSRPLAENGARINEFVDRVLGSPGFSPSANGPTAEPHTRERV